MVRPASKRPYRCSSLLSGCYTQTSLASSQQSCFSSSPRDQSSQWSDSSPSFSTSCKASLFFSSHKRRSGARISVRATSYWKGMLKIRLSHGSRAQWLCMLSSATSSFSSSSSPFSIFVAVWRPEWLQPRKIIFGTQVPLKIHRWSKTSLTWRTTVDLSIRELECDSKLWRMTPQWWSNITLFTNT